MILGLLYGILLSLVTYFQFGMNPLLLGLVVGMSVAASIMVAATVGTLVPILLKRLNIDPAIATGPFVTTSVDILGVLFYFSIASLFLEIG